MADIYSHSCTQLWSHVFIIQDEMLQTIKNYIAAIIIGYFFILESQNNVFHNTYYKEPSYYYNILIDESYS